MEGTSDRWTVTCRLEMVFDSEAQAESVQKSVALDNEGFVRSSLEGDRIVAEMQAGSLKSLLHTLDDYLACISVAERVVAKSS